ncbi:hypothetical protein L1987_02065 [Smallanthus sonchifolius]|uniref:Uncharacterized protein n=1 Tax=Smallanthus sonchifolius TaxID=185202 RepID=A0ACB9K6S9_9ASTR|nr:hypothetical protein L1987_02065 [Smallanthus sonchifolius]
MLVALRMSRHWDKKGYRPSYRHVNGGGGDGEPKSELNPKMIIDLSDEPEASRQRIKTVANKEVEAHRDQKSGNGGGKGKQVVKPLLDVVLGKKVAKGVGEKEKVTGLGPSQEASKDNLVDSSSKPARDETGGGTFRAASEMQ